MADVTLVIDDDEESREWAQFVQLDTPVLTGTEETVLDLIIRTKGHTQSILINTDNYERGFFLASLAARSNTGKISFAGVISATLPDVLDNVVFIVDEIPVTLKKQDAFVLDGSAIDWVTLVRSLTFRGGPM